MDTEAQDSFVPWVGKGMVVAGLSVGPGDVALCACLTKFRGRLARKLLTPRIGVHGSRRQLGGLGPGGGSRLPDRKPVVTMRHMVDVLTDQEQREAFGRAGTLFVDTVARLPPDALDHPGLGVWSIRELIGHTCRALLTVEQYAGRSSSSGRLAGPADYFIEALRDEAIHAAVADRAKASVALLGDHPASAVAEIVGRMIQLVACLPDEHPVGTPMGQMTLAGYLPTRTFELVVHTLDLAKAAGLAVEMPTSALAVSLRLSTEIAMRSGRGGGLLMALAGRESMQPNLLRLGPD